MSLPVSDEQHEYRVTWQRKGLSKRRKLYQRRDAAEKWMRRLTAESFANENPDDYACCSGYYCGCGGISNAEAWEQQYGQMPRLVIGPTLESRPVGDWTAA